MKAGKVAHNLDGSDNQADGYLSTEADEDPYVGVEALPLRV